MNDILNVLWDSTDDLHRRFGKYPPVAEETLRVFDEEVGEFGEAAVGMMLEEAGSVSDVCCEAADVLVTILATLTALGIKREQFIESALAVVAKNDAKTFETHIINPATGKIQRRGR